jgi:hypothetical protein
MRIIWWKMTKVKKAGATDLKKKRKAIIPTMRGSIEEDGGGDVDVNVNDTPTEDKEAQTSGAEEAAQSW